MQKSSKLRNAVKGSRIDYLFLPLNLPLKSKNNATLVPSSVFKHAPNIKSMVQILITSTLFLILPTICYCDDTFNATSINQNFDSNTVEQCSETKLSSNQNFSLAFFIVLVTLLLLSMNERLSILIEDNKLWLIVSRTICLVVIAWAAINLLILSER